jgi:hypothetical protein
MRHRCQTRPSVAKLVFRWIDERPYIKFCVAKGLINYSSLARVLQRELKLNKFDAILVAIRRYKEGLRHVAEPSPEIRAIIKRSSLEVKTGINVYMLKNPSLMAKMLDSFEGTYLHLIKGYDYYLIITDMALPKPFIKKHDCLVELRIKSPKQIEHTQGVIFYLYQCLFERNINILETYSCWTDTLILIEKSDLLSALKALEELGIK